KKVVILEKILKIDVKTGENISIDGMGSYSLSAEGGGTFKIKRLDFFWDAPEEIKNLGK
ncbi:MAG: hypothetical protein GY950_19650, partial [bacterium]|nr:hypothetical protein [bacterium]